MSPRFWASLREEPLGELSVLDVGTGTGRLALALAPYSRRVVGLDRDAAALADAETVEYDGFAPDLVVAHLCVSDAIIARAGRVLASGHVLAFVALHADQWRETGRRSRFAYDEDQARRALAAAGLAVERLEVEREVQRFESVEQALAAAVALEERWRADGRWFRYIRFLEQGGRTLTRAHLVVKARRP